MLSAKGYLCVLFLDTHNCNTVEYMILDPLYEKVINGFPTFHHMKRNNKERHFDNWQVDWLFVLLPIILDYDIVYFLDTLKPCAESSADGNHGSNIDYTGSMLIYNC